MHNNTTGKIMEPNKKIVIAVTSTLTVIILVGLILYGNYLKKLEDKNLTYYYQTYQPPYSKTNVSGNLDSELSLLNGLTPAAQSFFKNSIEIRKSYQEYNAYKHFLRDRDSNGQIDVMDADGYLHLNPPGGYEPNPDLYQNIPKTIPTIFYRYVKDCATKTTIERQIISTSNSYSNYIGSDRYQEQCIGDGSYDNYYVESKTALE
jgi:hypothetical protein